MMDDIMEQARLIYEQGAREKKRKITWELERSPDLDFIIEVAKLKGWLDTPPRVQVRKVIEPTYDNSIKISWAIEPYEEDCDCPNILKFEDLPLDLAPNTTNNDG